MKLSLKRKVVLVIVLFTFVLSVCSVLLSYLTYINSFEDYYESLASSIAKSTATVVNKQQVEAVAEEVVKTYRRVYEEGSLVPERDSYTQKELEARLVELMGGRAAEEIVFGNVTTGAANDIQQATNLARAMVTQYGMSEKFGLMGLASQENQYLTGRTVLNCGDATAAEIDQEVMRILKEAYEEAKNLLRENRDAMDQIAAFLIEKETITGKEFMEIFRRVKGLPEPEPKKEEPEGIPDTEHFKKDETPSGDGAKEQSAPAHGIETEEKSLPQSGSVTDEEGGWIQAGEDGRDPQ